MKIPAMADSKAEYKAQHTSSQSSKYQCFIPLSKSTMAELLGVVASGMSVVSLGIQIAESIQKLRAFYALVQAAPADILLLLDELETLSLILEDIDQSFQDEVFPNARAKLIVMKSYRLCRNSGHALTALAKDLERGIQSGKSKGGFRMALKKDKIEDLRKRLESAKSTLQLANQCYYQSMQSQNWMSQEQNLDQIRTSVSQISGMMIEFSSGKEKTMMARDGDPNVEAESVMRRNVDDEQQYTPKRSRLVTSRLTNRTGMKLSGSFGLMIAIHGHSTMTSLSISLPPWLYARRCHLCLVKARQGWDYSFRSYRMVPYDADVFQHCMAGNVAALQQLFRSGASSPFEVDPDGRTPLHVSFKIQPSDIELTKASTQPYMYVPRFAAFSLRMVQMALQGHLGRVNLSLFALMTFGIGRNATIRIRNVEACQPIRKYFMIDSLHYLARKSLFTTKSIQDSLASSDHD